MQDRRASLLIFIEFFPLLGQLVRSWMVSVRESILFEVRFAHRYLTDKKYRFMIRHEKLFMNKTDEIVDEVLEHLDRLKESPRDPEFKMYPLSQIMGHFKAKLSEQITKINAEESVKNKLDIYDIADITNELADVALVKLKESMISEWRILS